MTCAAPIGGFFERHEPDNAGPSVLDSWTAGRPYGAFVNARSAFAALVAQHPAATVWLPAFLCADLVSDAFATRVRFYPVLEGFKPDLAPVETTAKPGDIVLLAGPFGLPLTATPRRADLILVEDRAQALSAGPAAGWTLYSPRKLLGVADGGLLVSPGDMPPAPQPTRQPDTETLWRAPDLRADDPRGARNSEWHAANQAKEAAMAAAPDAITERSRTILATTSLESLAASRLANWRRLDARLAGWSALPSNPVAPPLGYVLRLDPATRDRVLAALHVQRIFAAVHWPHLAAPATAFPRETAWTRELITLPCDHRYGAAEMDRIAEAVLGLLA